MQEGGDERRASRGWDWLGISTLLRRTLQRGGGCFPQGPEDGGTVRIKEADGILGVGVQRERKNLDVSSQKSARVPAACTPSHPLLRWALALVPHPHQVQQEQRGVAVP